MLTITQIAADQLNIELSGKIDADEMRRALDDLIERSETIQHGKMLYRIPDFAMPSFAAIGVEMTRLPQLFSLLGKFDRCAVLTDAGWLQTAAELEGKLFPGLAIKSFALTEEAAAQSWLESANAP